MVSSVRAVIDTSVLFEGLTHRSPASNVIDAWAARRFEPCVSTALALEYEDVLSRKLSPRRGDIVLPALQALLSRCRFVPIRFTYRPASPDPGDDLVVDCVLNSQALLVTHNVKDFSGPAKELGFEVLGPEEFSTRLSKGGSL